MKRRLFTLLCLVTLAATAHGTPSPELPPNARLAFSEDWALGRIDPEKWYSLHKKWGNGNHGVVRNNVFIAKDTVNGEQRNVLVCRGHGDEYRGTLPGWNGQTTRVGGVIVSKPFFASGRFDIVMKIGTTEKNPNGPDDPTRPIGSVPAIWTYAYRWVQAPAGEDPTAFSSKNPLYNPTFKNQYNATEYWSELDFPEFGKNQDLHTGLYNTFLNRNHQSRRFSTSPAIDGQYHTFTTIWRTHLIPLDDITDDQVVEHEGYWWIKDPAVSYDRTRGNPLRRLGPNRYALCAGKEAHHFIDGDFVGTNPTFVPAMAAQLNIGIWFPDWGGAAPWRESTISVANVTVWQYDDPGDVRGILTEDIPPNMDEQGKPLSK